MGIPASAIKTSGKFVKNIGNKEIRFRNRTAVGVLVAASLIAANGDAREGGATFARGVSSVAPYVGSVIAGGFNFLEGVFGIDSDSFPKSVDLPRIDLPKVVANPGSTTQESSQHARVAISPGGIACAEVITVGSAGSGDGPIDIASSAGVPNANSYLVASNSDRIPYPGDEVAICK